MAQKACLLSIKNNYTSLTDAETTVADYILQNSAAVIHMPIATFAAMQVLQSLPL